MTTMMAMTSTPTRRPGEFPDLLVEWNKDTPIVHLGGPAIEPVRRSRPRGRTGDHTPDGFYIASGPGLLPGHALELTALLDAAPMVAA